MLTKTSIMSGKLYVHHDDRQRANSVIISSHGGYYRDNFTFHVGQDCLPGTKIHFYQPHGEVLSLNIGNSTTGKVTPIETHSGDKEPNVINYRLSKFQGAKHGSESETYDVIGKVIESARGEHRQNDYQLRRDNVDRFRNIQLERELTESEAKQLGMWESLLNGWGDIERRDVATIRNRFYNDSVYLKDAVQALQRHNRSYLDIYCSFCRSYTG